MIDRSPSCLAAAMARAVLALMVVLAGFLPAAAQQKDKIRLAGQVWYPTFPMYTAIENGIYAKWGLDPTIKIFPSGAACRRPCKASSSASSSPASSARRRSSTS